MALHHRFDLRKRRFQLAVLIEGRLPVDAVGYADAVVAARVVLALIVALARLLLGNAARLSFAHVTVDAADIATRGPARSTRPRGGALSGFAHLGRSARFSALAPPCVVVFGGSATAPNYRPEQERERDPSVAT